MQMFSGGLKQLWVEPWMVIYQYMMCVWLHPTRKCFVSLSASQLQLLLQKHRHPVKVLLQLASLFLKTSQQMLPIQMFPSTANGNGRNVLSL